MPGGISPDMMRAVLARPMPVRTTADVDVDPLPICTSKTLEECITAFRAASAAKQKQYWLLAAIAFRVERGVGGRPRRQGDERDTRRAETAIQRFCKEVGISRNTFQRLTRTYAVFFGETRTSRGTSFISLPSFTHHEIAARLTNSPAEAVNAVAFAYGQSWSANMLETMLKLTSDRPKPDPMDRWLATSNPGRRMTRFLEAFFRRLARTIDPWPAEMRMRVPYLLWQLAEHVKRTLPPPEDDAPAWVRDLTSDCSDPIGSRDAEAVQ
jgi:hypothetical protein